MADFSCLDYRIVCLQQLSSKKVYFARDGVGDCRLCKSDDLNKLCKDYYPIKMFHIIVQDDKELKK